MKFIDSLNVVLQHEGGFAKVPMDKGGETYRGISRVNFPNWPGWPIVDQNKPLKKNDIIINRHLDKLVANFYFENFWQKINADQLPGSIRTLLFVFAVNSGVKTAVKVFQTVLEDTLNKPTFIDGIVGPETIKFANQADQKILFDNLKEARLKFYNSIVANNPTQKKFLKGWLNRLESFKYTTVLTTSIILIGLFAYLLIKSN